METDKIIGIIASVATAVSLLPQLIKLLKEKKSDNISYGMISILFVGLILWITYGVMKEDWIIVISNSVSLLLNILIVIFSVKYTKKTFV